MSILDMRTILIGFVVSDFICALVIAYLWSQNRRRSPGISLWAIDYILQVLSILLIGLRGVLPDFLSMVGGNSLNIAGSILLLIGLERYLGIKGRQFHNWLLLTVFTLIHTYFSVFRPVLAVRNVNMALALAIVSAQCAWLLLFRAEAGLRKATKSAGVVFSLYILVSILSIANSLFTAVGNDYLRSGLLDALILLADQMLFIALTFSLFLMVNRRLSSVLDEDIAARIHTEQELRSSEEILSAAFQSIPDALILSSANDGTILDVNQNFLRIMEYGREETIGKTTIDLNLWNEAADRSAYISLLRAEGRARNFESVFRKKSGETLTGLISGEILHLRQGAFMLSVIHDATGQRALEREVGLERDRLVVEIAERRQVEDALRESEAKFRSMFENMAAASCLDELVYEGGIAVDYRVLDINPAFEKIIGVRREEAVGRRASELYCGPGEAIPFFDTYVQVAETGQSKHFEAYFPPIGKFLQVTASCPSRGKFQTVFTDITERREMERQNEYLASFPTLNTNPVLEIGIDGKIRYANEAALETLERLGLEPDARQYFPDTPEALAQLRSNCAAGPIREEFQLGGAYFLRDVSSVGEGALRTYVVDITQRVLLEREIHELNATLDLRIQQRTAELSLANEELEAFSYSVSHDLRAPLRGIDGFSHAFLEDYGGLIPAEGRMYLERIRNATQRMGRIIEDMLFLSHIVRAPLDLKKNDISALAHEVMEELAKSEPERIVNWKVESGMTAICDQHLVRIILNNLLGNAWKFTSKTEKASIVVGLRKDPKHDHIFFVRDNGAGFDMRYKDKLFVAFQRLHAQTEYPGTGVGLSIVQRAVQRHGGEVWAESEVGQGASFYFSIPVLHVSESSKEEQGNG